MRPMPGLSGFLALPSCLACLYSSGFAMVIEAGGNAVILPSCGRISSEVSLCASDTSETRWTTVEHVFFGLRAHRGGKLFSAPSKQEMYQ
jgi:hypothetical protein